jgi:hypothetical protein
MYYGVSVSRRLNIWKYGSTLNFQQVSALIHYVCLKPSKSAVRILSELLAGSSGSFTMNSNFVLHPYFSYWTDCMFECVIMTRPSSGSVLWRWGSVKASSITSSPSQPMAPITASGEILLIIKWFAHSLVARCLHLMLLVSVLVCAGWIPRRSVLVTASSRLAHRCGMGCYTSQRTCWPGFVSRSNWYYRYYTSFEQCWLSLSTDHFTKYSFIGLPPRTASDACRIAYAESEVN